MKLDPVDKKLLNDVAEFGFQALHILAEGDHPSFTFSIGFTETLGSPEVIVFGLKRELMHNMLWELFRQIQAGAMLEDGARWGNLIEGFDCVSRPVHPDWNREYLGSAIWYRRYRTGRDDVTAYELLWPGAQQGLYPWETGCDPFVISSQPALYLPRTKGLA
ncbi:MAG: DUF4262 domain-containing protein [Caulobacteraceae bacterium]